MIEAKCRCYWSLINNPLHRRNARRNFTWEALSQIKAVDVQKLLMLHTAANSNVVDICKSLKQQGKDLIEQIHAAVLLCCLHGTDNPLSLPSLQY